MKKLILTFALAFIATIGFSASSFACSSCGCSGVKAAHSHAGDMAGKTCGCSGEKNCGCKGKKMGKKPCKMCKKAKAQGTTCTKCDEAKAYYDKKEAKKSNWGSKSSSDIFFNE